MIHILLPAYNEERSITLLLDRIKQALKNFTGNYVVLVVDDGSTDTTKKVVEFLSNRLPVRIISHRSNQGLGAAMDTGLKEIMCTSSAEDIIVTMDADNTHDPALIQEMVNKINLGYDVIIASRYQKGGQEVGLSLRRKFFSKVVNVILKIIFPIIGAKDYTSGYRAYKGARLKEAFSFYNGKLVEEKGFLCMAEILIKLRRLISLRVVEVPLVLRYDLKNTPSKMKVMRTILRYLRMIGKGALAWRR